jgi:eukaryotic-like serine/threonine-protein kinase
MDSEGDEQDFLIAALTTIREGEATTCNDNPADRTDGESVDSADPAARTDVDSLQSTIDTLGSDGAQGTDLTNRDDHDSNRIPYRYSDGSLISAFEGTIGPSQVSLPTSGQGRTDIVPGFEILSELGRGGMGVVYKAREIRLKRLVALKMIRDDWLGSTEHIARFEIEAEALARLDHLNIVKIYQIGKARRVPFVVLELLEGGSLKKRLAGNPQPVRETALLSTLARAVHAAHVAGILHRDIKPSNILFDGEGVPKITDFGLAKRLEVDEGETRTGQLIGSPSYMAPELAKGWDREIGPAADVYSLGAILYEMLTGRPPFKGTTVEETIRMVLDQEPVPPSRLRPQLPIDLETICLKSIARDAPKRYPDALSLAEDLDRFLHGQPIRARRTPFWERGIKLARRHQVTTVVLLIGMIATGVGAYTWQRAKVRESDRVDGLLRVSGQEYSNAQLASVRTNWDEVRRIASGLARRLEPESDPLLANLRAMAVNLDAIAGRELEQQHALLAQQQARAEAEARFRQFITAQDEALFLDTRFGGLDLEYSVEAACRSARSALAVFGAAASGDEWVLCALPPTLTPPQQETVKRGFYELLLILADGVSQTPKVEPAQRAQAALRILDQTAGVRLAATRAYHERRSKYLEMAGDHTEADRELDEAQRVTTDDAFDLFLIGRELTKRSEWKEAIPYFERASRHSDQFWAQCLLAICHLQQREPSKALVGLRACVHEKPDCVWLYMLRGIANAAEGELARELARSLGAPAPALKRRAADRFDDAEADYAKAITLLGDKPENRELHYALLVNRGIIRLERPELTAAIADFQAAIRLNNGRFEAFSSLSQAYDRQGRTEDALEQIARAIALKPKWAPLYRARADCCLGLKNLSPDLSDLSVRHLQLAIHNLSPQRRAAALVSLEQAIEHESPADQIIAVDRTKQAALLREEGRHADALGSCDAALAIAPRYLLAHGVRILVLLDLKRYDDDMIQSCDVLLASGKPDAKLYELRGMAKDKREDSEGALADYNLSLAIDAKNPRLLRRRGWWNLEQGAIGRAVQNFDEVIELAPGDADAYSGRGMARVRLGEYRDAVSDAEQALALDKTSWRIAYNAARIHALSAKVASSEIRKNGQAAVRLVERYQDNAVELVRRARQLATVQHELVKFREALRTDLAFKPLGRRLGSVESQKLDQP